MTIHNIGSINIDHIYRVPHLVQPGETLTSRSLDTVLGGKGANQSVAIARAGCDVQHIGKVSASDQWAVDQLATSGVKTDQIQFVSGASGHAIIQVDDAGENSIVLHGGANQMLTRDDVASGLANATSGDWVLLQNECNALDSVFSEAIAKNLSVAFNPAPMSPAIANLPLRSCALLVLNEIEAQQLAGLADDAAAREALLTQYPDTTLVFTLGSRGAVLYQRGVCEAADAFSVDVVDTTGAGDTFVGYLLAAMQQKKSPAEALRRASAAAALSVTRPGAAPSIPIAADVDAFLATHST